MNSSPPEDPRAVNVELVGNELVVRLEDGRVVHVRGLLAPAASTQR